MDNRELIEHLLAFDVITNAEKTCKASYNHDSLTQRVAALNFIKKSQKLSKELKANSDTYRSMTYLDLINTVISEGFTPIYSESFEGGGYGGKPVTEALIALYNEDNGVLVVAESFGGSSVNKASMYYNWVPRQTNKDWDRATSSGGFVKNGVVWQGHHPIEEAFRYKMDLLKRKGFFAKQWAEQPYLWLLNYMEGRTSKDSDAINKKKLVMFPEHVRKFILA